MKRLWNWIAALGLGRDKTEQEAVQQRLDTPAIRFVWTIDVSRLSGSEQDRAITAWRKKFKSYSPYGFRSQPPSTVPHLISGVNKM